MKIDFAQNGTATCLYSELIDLRSLGHVTMERASEIVWNESAQEWQVLSLSGEVLHHNPSRQECLDWEHDHL